MKQIRTAREMLAQIENDFFKGVSLSEASLLKGDECRTFILSQVERLLTEKRGEMPLAMYLSDMFWTADEGRVPMPWEDTPAIRKPGYRTTPLLMPEDRQSLTSEEIERLRLILKIAGLCHDLSLHFRFNLKETFGIRNVFWVSNKKLVEWLTSTEYEQIAMHTAYTLKRHAINVYEAMGYQPAQDAMAELFSSKYRELVHFPDSTKIPPRDYVKVILDELLRIERHWQRGRRLKLEAEVVKLHDEIYGVVPRQFDKGVLVAAQELYEYMDKELCGCLVLKEYNEDAIRWSEQPEKVKRIATEAFGRFAEKVREVQAKYLGEGWVEDRSLEFSYLFSHAERCARGWWRKEDDAL